MNITASRARGAMPLLVGAAVVAAACGPKPGVETEQARAIEPTTTLDESAPSDPSEPGPAEDAQGTTTTLPPTTVPPTTAPPEDTLPEDPLLDEAVDDSLLFDLDRFDVIVSRRPTTVIDERDAAGEIVSRGFRTAAVLGDGAIVAAGYEFPTTTDGSTFGALWHSTDGFEWSRVGRDVTSGQGEQLVPVVLADIDGRAAVAVASIEFIDDSSAVDYGLAGSWSSGDGSTWGAGALIGDASIHTGVLFGDQLVVAGAADPNSPNFTAALYTEPTADGLWTKTNLDANEAPSLVNDVIVVGNILLAVGGTASTDPASPAPGTLGAMQLTSGPVDAAVWRSIDGVGWTAVGTEAFAGLSGPALAESIAAIGDELFLLVSTVVGDQTVLEIYRSNDFGDTWTALPLPLAIDRDVGADTRLGTAGLWSVDGALVVAEGRLTPAGQRLFMTVIDPDSNETVMHELSAELDVDELGDVIDLDAIALGLGRSTLSQDPAGLQTIEIRRIDPPESGDTPASSA